MTHDEAWVQAQAERMAFRESVQEQMAAMIREMAERGEIDVDPENVHWGTPPPLVHVSGTWYRIDSLDAAWSEAEAALPEGWFLVLSDDPRYTAEATCVAKNGAGGYTTTGHDEAEADTPAAALRALASKLRERAG